MKFLERFSILWLSEACRRMPRGSSDVGLLKCDDRWQRQAMPIRPFRPLALPLKEEKAPKFAAFKDERIHEGARLLFRPLSLIVIVFGLLPFSEARAQVKVDISSEDARKAAGKTTLDDLAVHDSAFIYQSFCIKDAGVYVPGWTNPADLASSTYNASGIILRIEILPGKKVKGVWVDAAKAQQVARGNSSAGAILSKEDYNREATLAIARIFEGGLFGVNSCDDEQRANTLRPMSLYAIECINGYSKISELLASLKLKSK